MATAYCAQRADLIGYHRMLTAWQEAQRDPVIKRGIGLWLGVLNENRSSYESSLGNYHPSARRMMGITYASVPGAQKPANMPTPKRGESRTAMSAVTLPRFRASSLNARRPRGWRPYEERRTMWQGGNTYVKCVLIRYA